MQISSVNQNIIAMQQAQTQMNDFAKDIASLTKAPKQNQEVTQDLLDAIVNQIPTQIAYEANAGVISTQNAVQDSLLNIKA